MSSLKALLGAGGGSGGSGGGVPIGEIVDSIYSRSAPTWLPVQAFPPNVSYLQASYSELAAILPNSAKITAPTFTHDSVGNNGRAVGRVGSRWVEMDNGGVVYHQNSTTITDFLGARTATRIFSAIANDGESESYQTSYNQWIQPWRQTTGWFANSRAFFTPLDTTLGHQHVFSTTDGVTWNHVGNLPNNYTSVRFRGAVGSTMVVTDGNSTRYCYSTNNGAAWTSGTLPFTPRDGSVSSGTLMIMMSGAQNYYTSADGINWTLRTAPGVLGYNFPSLNFLNNTWYFMPNNSGPIFTSSDAITWTVRPDGPLGRIFPSHHANGLFFSGASGFGNTSPIYVSPDGVDWTARTLGSATATSFHYMLFSGSNFYAIGTGLGGRMIFQIATSNTEFIIPATASPAGQLKYIKAK
jgi:hypothetical protein